MQGSGSTALVSGGGGFIGSHLVERLLRDGYEVRVLDNFATGRRENVSHLPTRSSWSRATCRATSAPTPPSRGCDLVFHLAALPSVPRSVQDPLTSNASNVIGTLNILLAARDEGVRRVVFSSSSSIYGANPDLPKREDMPTAADGSLCRLKAGRRGLLPRLLSGLRTGDGRPALLQHLRPSSGSRSPVLGGDPATSSRAVLEGRRPVIHGDGEQSRDFTYIDNAIDANLLAAARRGSRWRDLQHRLRGADHPQRPAAARSEDLTGREVEAVHTDPRPGDVPHSLADIWKAREPAGLRSPHRYLGGTPPHNPLLWTKVSPEKCRYGKRCHYLVILLTPQGMLSYLPRLSAAKPWEA